MSLRLNTPHKYWPKNKPIPVGWEIVDTLAETHHGKYVVLIALTGAGTEKCEKDEISH